MADDDKDWDAAAVASFAGGWVAQALSDAAQRGILLVHQFENPQFNGDGTVVLPVLLASGLRLTVTVEVHA